MIDSLAYSAEQALLGACLNDSRAYAAGGALRREHWSDSRHAMIYTAIAQAAKQGPTGPLEVAEQLGDFREKYYPYLLELYAASAVQPASAGEYARIIREHTKLRLAHGILRDALDEIEGAGVPPHRTSDLLARLGERLAEIGETLADRGGYLRFREALDLALAERLRKRECKGMPTTLPRVDFLTGGLAGGTLTVIGARTGIGKSLVAGQIAINAALRLGRPTGLISLEMSAGQIMNRMLSYLYGEDPKLPEGDAPLYIDCNSRELDAISARVREWRLVHEIELCIIDYLQIIAAGGYRQRYEEVGAISRTLKSLAMELNIPLLVLAQLSREHLRTGRPPTLVDLREAGNIEQDADNVFLLHCNRDRHPIIELTLAKQRDGPSGEVIDLEFIPERLCLREILP